MPTYKIRPYRQNIPRPMRQKGFTLIELLIALGLGVILVAGFSFAVFQYLKFAERRDTEQRIRDLVQATRAMYAKEAPDIASDPKGNVQRLLLSDNRQMVTYGCTDAETDDEPQRKNLYPLMNFTQLSSSNLSTDGHKRTVCTFISPLLYRDTAGTRIYYRSVAFVSRGENGVFEPAVKNKPLFVPENPKATIEASTGAVNTNYILQLHPEADDVGAVMDGYQVMADGLAETQSRLNKLKDVYQTYFKVGYLANASRNMALDYFMYAPDAKTMTDPSRTLIQNTHNSVGTPHLMQGVSAAFFRSPANGGPAVLRLASDGGGKPGLFTNSSDGNVMAKNRLAEFGLAPTDLYDGWGNSIYIDNSSPEVRSPLNPVESRRVPPFTARFIAYMPSPKGAAQQRTAFSLTAIGVY